MEPWCKQLVSQQRSAHRRTVPLPPVLTVAAIFWSFSRFISAPALTQNLGEWRKTLSLSLERITHGTTMLLSSTQLHPARNFTQQAMQSTIPRRYRQNETSDEIWRSAPPPVGQKKGLILRVLHVHILKSITWRGARRNSMYTVSDVKPRILHSQRQHTQKHS